MANQGRSFTGERKVRLGDVDRFGRLRLDALTRYTQDVSDDDTTDAGLPQAPGWVVRSTVVDQLMPASLAESLSFTTFCSGLGKRWAERRLSIVGAGGARYEVATLWVCVDPDSGQPHPLTDDFLALYGQAADGRKVSARLKNPRPADQPGDGAGNDVATERWQLRSSDYDIYGHVNNAAYWAAVEQWAHGEVLTGPLRARLEYGAGLAPARSVAIARRTVEQPGGPGLRLWWLAGDAGGGGEDDVTTCSDAQPVASVDLRPLVTDPYQVPG
jgi:acyl-ACP thioesterase